MKAAGQKPSLLHITKTVLLTVLSGIGLSAPAATPPPTSLVAVYRLDGNANDSSGNGFHGVVNGATPGVDRFGSANSAYVFSNEFEFISLPTTLTTNSQGTIAFWIRIDKLLTGLTGAGSYNPFGAVEPNADKALLIGLGDFTQLLNDEMLGVTISSNPQNGRSGVARTNITEITPGWHHVAVTTSATGHAYYLNGQKFFPTLFNGSVTTNDNLLPINAIQIRLGGAISSDSTNRAFALDDVFIYKRVLSDAEIRALAEPIVVTIRLSQVEVCWNSQSNLTYQVQYRSDLTTNLWVNLGGSTSSTNSMTCVFDSVPRGQPERYYQVIQLE